MAVGSVRVGFAARCGRPEPVPLFLLCQSELMNNQLKWNPPSFILVYKIRSPIFLLERLVNEFHHILENSLISSHLSLLATRKESSE